MSRLDPAVIAQQISNLLLVNPELVDDEVLRADMIEGATEAFEFLRGLEAKRREATSLAGGIAGTIAELQTRLGRFERREQSIRNLMDKILKIAELRRAELPEAMLYYRNNAPKVIITDETKLPEHLCRIRYEPDKVAIGALLKSGQEVEGATLSNAEPILAIRTK